MPRFISRFILFPAAYRRRERGIALIGVLWLIALLASFAGGITLLARTDSLIAHDELEDLRAEGLADAAVFLVLNDLSDPRTAKTVPIDGQASVVHVSGHDLTVSVQDEAGKIDINFAPKELLASLFSSVSLSLNESSRIAEAIVEARKKASFHSLEELQAIPGINSTLLQRIRPALTIYSERPTVYMALAPQQVLAAMPDMDEQKIAQILVRRKQKMPSSGEVQGQETFDGRAVTIVASAHEGRNYFPRRAVVRMTGNIYQPYWVYEWTSSD
jgi:general secretion pathway protein K